MPSKILGSASANKISNFFNYSNSYLRWLLVIAVITASCLWRHVDGLVGDDGAFFLKYAENMTEGFFWFYNPESGPVWGASAPLYPLLIAPLLKFGVDPVIAIKVIGIALLNAAGLLGYEYFARDKSSYGFIFVVLLALNTNIIYNGIAGLETPLTVFLISWIVYDIRNYEQSKAKSGRSFLSIIKVPIIIGILSINKIDLIPFAFSLVIAYCFVVKSYKERIIAILSPLIILLSFHLFALIYFGFPLPNSFLTKMLHQNHLTKSISHDWILNDLKATSIIVLVTTVMVIIAIFIEFVKYLLRANSARYQLIPISFMPTGLCLSFLFIYFFLGYSLKPPFEPYTWYVAPINFAACYLSTMFVVAVDSKIVLRSV